MLSVLNTATSSSYFKDLEAVFWHSMFSTKIGQIIGELDKVTERSKIVFGQTSDQYLNFLDILIYYRQALGKPNLDEILLALET